MKIGMKLTEKQIETSILAFLEYTPGCSFHKLNNTGIYDPKKGGFRKVVNKYCPKGIADIVGSYNNLIAWIEVKTPEEYKYLMKHYEELRCYVGLDKKKNHYRNQIAFIEGKKRVGNIAFFADSIDMVKEKLLKVNNA